jgi:hypothetical protein
VKRQPSSGLAASICTPGIRFTIHTALSAREHLAPVLARFNAHYEGHMKADPSDPCVSSNAIYPVGDAADEALVAAIMATDPEIRDWQLDRVIKDARPARAVIEGDNLYVAYPDPDEDLRWPDEPEELPRHANRMHLLVIPLARVVDLNAKGGDS